jgi:hypothetical protein
VGNCFRAITLIISSIEIPPFMLTLSQDSRQCLLTWDCWRLEFVWQGDRWSHALWQDLNGVRRDSHTSLEGTTEQSWPTSPAFQDLHTERIRPDCCEIQLLGQAGKNHYSGAIRCDAAQNVIDFDLAVRIQSAPTPPLTMTTYLIPFGSHRTAWQVQPQPIPNFPELTVKAGLPAIDVDPPAVAVQLVLEDLQTLKFERHRATIRWKYRLVLEQ